MKGRVIYVDFARRCRMFKDTFIIPKDFDTASHYGDAFSYLTSDTFKAYLTNRMTEKPLYSDEFCRAFIRGYNETITRLESNHDDDTY